MTFAFYFAAVGFLAFLPNTCASVDSCGSSICIPDDDQKAYCCGVNDHTCCYTTYSVATIWWFWVILVVGVISIGSCIACCCCRYRHHHVPYVVMGNANPTPGITVVQSSQSNVTQLQAPTCYPQPAACHPAPQPGYPGHGYPPPYGRC